MTWTPQFERWRHGGWYVTNVRYPSAGSRLHLKAMILDSRSALWAWEARLDDTLPADAEGC